MLPMSRAIPLVLTTIASCVQRNWDPTLPMTQNSSVCDEDAWHP